MKTLSFLIGPELYWLALYWASGWIAQRNEPPSSAGNTLIERACLWGMFAAVALSFLAYSVPGAAQQRWWLLARLAVAAVVGGNLCLFRLIDGIDYGDSRNSGVLGIWVYGCMLGGLALAIGAGVAIYALRRAAAID